MLESFPGVLHVKRPEKRDTESQPESSSDKAGSELREQGADRVERRESGERLWRTRGKRHAVDAARRTGTELAEMIGAPFVDHNSSVFHS